MTKTMRTPRGSARTKRRRNMAQFNAARQARLEREQKERDEYVQISFTLTRSKELG